MTMSEERWLPVVDWEGLYEVSDLGRVRSLDRVTQVYDKRYGWVSRPYTGRMLVLAVNAREGRPQVTLCRTVEGVREQRIEFVHKLVAKAFLGPKPPGAQCRHLNGNPADNRVVNLAWGTSKENIQDRLDHGRDFHARQAACSRGHVLIPENLVPVSRRKGHRMCLACHRMRADFRPYLGRPDSSAARQRLADWHFNQILSAYEAAPAS